MGTVLPDNPASQLAFFQVHAPMWVAQAGTIGLGQEQAAQVAAATRAAAAALAAAEAARRASIDATRAWQDAAGELRRVGGAAVMSIKAHATVSRDPGVLVRAGIGAPEKPGPGRRSASEKSEALPRVRACTATPLNFARAKVEWTCGAGAMMGAGAGMSYRVSRSINGGPLKLIDVVGSPGAGRRTSTYVDESIPVGVQTVGYTITPMRGGAVGRMGPLASLELVPVGGVRQAA